MMTHTAAQLTKEEKTLTREMTHRYPTMEAAHTTGQNPTNSAEKLQQEE